MEFAAYHNHANPLYGYSSGYVRSSFAMAIETGNAKPWFENAFLSPSREVCAWERRRRAGLSGRTDVARG